MRLIRRRPMSATTRCAVPLCAVGIAHLILLVLGLPSTAQTWPQLPVKFVVTLGPRSGVDFAARLLGDRLSKRWAQSVVIESRPGGDAIVAVDGRNQRKRRPCSARLSHIRADRSSVHAAADALPG